MRSTFQEAKVENSILIYYYEYVLLVDPDPWGFW